MKLSEQVAQIEYAKEQLQKRVVVLTAENLALSDRVFELERVIKNPARMSPLALPPVMSRLLNMLIDHDLVSHNMAELALTRSGHYKTLGVHFSRLRRHLPNGVTIKNMQGQGWFIPSQEKAVLRAAIQ